MAIQSTASPQSVFDTVDDFLGPRDRRFFGEGFKRAVHRFTDIVVEVDDDQSGTISATLAVDYPADWSRKGANDQKAHLSTVDILAIGARLIETYLDRGQGLSESDRADTKLESVSIRAGVTPVEDELESFPATARIQRFDAAEISGRVSSVAQCTIGPMVMRCNVRHRKGTGGRQADHAQYGPVPAVPSLFADDFTLRQQFLESVTVDSARQLAHATVRIQSPNEHMTASALAIDAFVVGLQLGQVLLYSLDNLSRASSKTLWMRRTTIECREHATIAIPTTVAHTRLENSRLIEKSKNQVWRSADIVCEFEQVEMRCSVAHQIN